MKKLIAVILCACFALTFSACARNSGQSQSGSSSQSEPGSESGSSSFVEDDAFYQDVLLTFGARWYGNENNPLFLGVAQGPSFFDYTDGWTDADKLDVIDFYVLYKNMSWEDNLSFEELLEKYKSPFGDSGLFFPQELFEPFVQKYFDVSVEHLRSDPDIYSAEYKGYHVDFSGMGIGDSTAIDLEKVEHEGTLRRLYVQLTPPPNGGEVLHMILTIKLVPDGGYKFESYLPA